MYIYVGGVARDMTEQAIRDMFEPFGVVRAVKMASDSGLGFAVLEMPNDTEGNEAIQSLYKASRLIITQCNYEEDGNPVVSQVS